MSTFSVLRRYVEYGLGPDSRLAGVIEHLGKNDRVYRGIFELRVPNTRHNPRLIYGKLHGPRIVILNGFQK